MSSVKALSPQEVTEVCKNKIEKTAKSNITGGEHFQRQQKEEVILQRNFLDEADFKKFSDLNFSGGFPLGSVFMLGVPTFISKSELVKNFAIICYEMPIYNFKGEVE